MPSKAIPSSVFEFLKDLKENNNRDWFNEHKARYQEAHGHAVEFAESLMAAMGAHDHLVPMSGKQSLFRIYRDTRFSKNKTPYKKPF